MVEKAGEEMNHLYFLSMMELTQKMKEILKYFFDQEKY
jgi:hypothetical protein